MAKVNRNSIKVTLLLVSVIAVVGGPHQAAGAMHMIGQQEGRLRLAAASHVEPDTPIDPAAILAAARIIYVCSRTVFVKSEVIESELQKRKEFQQAGLFLTKDPKAADLIIEVRRSNFTTEYPYVVVDSRTKFIVASGKVNSLFGTAAGKIAKRFMKQVQTARTSAVVNSKK